MKPWKNAERRCKTKKYGRRNPETQQEGPTLKLKKAAKKPTSRTTNPKDQNQIMPHLWKLSTSNNK